MFAALDRRLKHNDRKISIAKDRELVKCRQVLEGKARALCEKRPRKTNKFNTLTVQDEEQLGKNGVLARQAKFKVTPLYSVVSATLQFDLRGCQEHHEMFVKDLGLNKDDQGTVEYVTFQENPTKTRQGGLRN